MSSNLDNKFKRFLIKKLIKNAEFNPYTQQLDMQSITLTKNDKREAIIEGGNYGYDQKKVSIFVQEILNEGFNLNSKIVQKHSIPPSVIPLEQHLKLRYQVNGRTNCDELLKIGERQYLLISHDRGSLTPSMILETITSPWELNSFIEFKIIEKTISNKERFYKTGEIVSIELIYPSELFEVLDTNEDVFRKNIYAVYPNKEDGFSDDVFSTEINEEMHYIIKKTGMNGEFYLISAPIFNMENVLKNKKRILSPACKFLNKPTEKTKSILTEKRGVIRFEDNYWRIVKKAQIKFSNE